MSVNVEVSKTGSESVLSTIRKFSRRVQGTGLVKNARKRRYFSRQASKTVKKKRTLKLLKRRAEFQKLVKEGKVADTPRRPTYSRPTSSSNESESSQKRANEGLPIAH